MEIKVSKKGAEITSLKCFDNEYIYQPKESTDENGNSYWNSQFPILFPIVGKLIHDCYRVNDNYYFLAKHGFVGDMKFEQIKNEEIINDLGETTKFVKTYTLYSTEETQRKYPFNFKLTVEYSYDETEEKGTLNIKTNVRKLDSKDMPFKIGFKPAFKCDYSTGNFRLYFKSKIHPKPGEEEVFYRKPMKTQEDELIDLDILDDINSIKDGYLRLNKDTFINGELIFKNMEYVDIYLEEYIKDLDAWDRIIKVSTQDFKYLGLWSKPNAPFICIEPLSGHTQIINDEIKQKLENKEFRNDLEDDQSIQWLKENFVFDSEDKTFTFKVKFYQLEDFDV